LKQHTGFSLIELLITIMIVGIISAIALPSYSNYMFKSRRNDAKDALLKLQAAEEKFRSNNPQYTSDANALEGISGQSLEGYYAINIANANGVQFVATAEAISTGKQAGDNECQKFAINQDGPVTTAGFANDRCWGK
jgi:type IV pilus assembly protein PilE